MTSDIILKGILAERSSQDRKWGEQNHSAFRWLAILTEEVGEVAEACLDVNTVRYYSELVQVAAVALAALESYERYGIMGAP